MAPLQAVLRGRFYVAGAIGTDSPRRTRRHEGLGGGGIFHREDRGDREGFQGTGMERHGRRGRPPSDLGFGIPGSERAAHRRRHHVFPLQPFVSFVSFAVKNPVTPVTPSPETRNQPSSSTSPASPRKPFPISPVSPVKNPSPPRQHHHPRPATSQAAAPRQLPPKPFVSSCSSW